MYNIAVVGAGEIGSRHLQGLVKSKLQLNLYIVDLSSENLRRAKQRIHEIAFEQNHIKIYYQNNLNDLPMCLDLAIIATTSSVRFNIIKSIISKSNIKSLLLEKVLFQRIEEYEFTSELLAKNEIKAWVNCPRRLYPYLQEIKKYFNSESVIDVSFSGGNWGLACNAIHLIDLVNYFSDEFIDSIDTRYLDKEFLVSKRSGFFEASGELKFRFGNGSSLTLVSKKETDNFLNLDIFSKNFRFNLFETVNMAVCQTDNNRTFSLKNKIQMPYQSDLTNLITEQILLSETSDLPTYEISKRLHIPFIENMTTFFQNNYNQDFNYCPIT